MSLPRFFSRVADAVGPVATLDPEALAKHLAGRTVALRAAQHCDDEPGAAAGALLAVNLAARLYPRMHLSGPRGWVDAAERLASSINPEVDLSADRPSGADGGLVTLRWDGDPCADDPGTVVTVAARGWNVHIDPVGLPDGTANPLTELAAAALGIGEVFRVVFADMLAGDGRHGRQPGGFNLVTAGDPTGRVPTVSSVVLPDAHLVGGGAIGQACILSLVAAGVRGRINVVDPQAVELSNLQRYVLATDSDVGAAKTVLASRATAGSGLSVVEVPTAWGADGRSGPGVAVALTALDSAIDRIGVAASLPGRVYNAWTQPADVGWSRHEAFGIEPCLACLYYPDRPRSHEYELIATALRQPPLRVLSYLVSRQPVGAPLPMIAAVPALPVPADAAQWTRRPLLADLIDAGYLDAGEAGVWAGRQIGQLYRDGICAGGLLRPPGGAKGEAALVPLAHQSALAGVMLAAQFVAASEERLRPWRPGPVEARLDMLRGLPQVLARPRARTSGCLCDDPFFRRTAESQTMVD